MNPFFAEYARRKRLAEIGVTLSADDIDPYTLEVFATISAAISRAESQKLDRERARHGRR